MNITFAIATLCLGGGQRMLAEITNGLVSRGHNVTIVMPQIGKVEHNISAKIVRTEDRVYITESDFPVSDIIVSTHFTLVSATQLASERGKGLHVRLCMGYEPLFYSENNLSFPSFNVTKNVIVISKSEQQIVEINHGIKAEIVPVGVSPTFRKIRERDSNGPLQICAVVRRAEGTVCWHRNQEYLLSELAMVRQMHPSIRVQLICPAAELAMAPTLQSMIQSNAFSITSAADDEEMCYLYNQSDLFVSASIYESASLPGMEATKCGCALVTLHAGGNVDFCKNEVNCLMSYGYEKRLGKDILQLISDPDKRKTLAYMGEEEAKSWTWDRSVNAFERAMYSFMNRG